MTDQQLYLIIGAPMLFNAVLIGLVVAYINAKFDGQNGILSERFNAINQRFASIDQRFDAIDRRFDEMRDLWRAELRRVEEILDARLKHLEER